MSRSRRETNEDHFTRPDVVREYASFDFLLPPENVILDLLGRDLSTKRVLDLGVGGGRTSLHLAALVASYVGVDYSDEMIAACRGRFPTSFGGRATFEVGDARDLHRFPSESFDVVLFAFQGLDSIVSHAERERALQEIRRVLGPAGLFIFSSDNLSYLRDGLSLRSMLRKTGWGRSSGRGTTKVFRGIRRIARNLKHGLQLRRLNREILSPAAREGRHVYVRRRFERSAEGFTSPNELIEIDGYAIVPEEQIAQLAAAGFEDVRLFDWKGLEARPGDEGLRQSQWVYYLCRRAAEPASPNVLAAPG